MVWKIKSVFATLVARKQDSAPPLPLLPPKAKPHNVKTEMTKTAKRSEDARNGAWEEGKTSAFSHRSVAPAPPSRRGAPVPRREMADTSPAGAASPLTRRRSPFPGAASPSHFLLFPPLLHHDVHFLPSRGQQGGRWKGFPLAWVASDTPPPLRKVAAIACSPSPWRRKEMQWSREGPHRQRAEGSPLRWATAPSGAAHCPPASEGT